MTNFKISVSEDYLPAARNAIKFWGNLNECLIKTSSDSWESNLERSFWSAWEMSERETREGFLDMVRRAFSEAGVFEYCIVELKL